MTSDPAPPRDYAAEVAKARSDVFANLKDLEMAAWQQGFDVGFARGWDAAIKRFRELMEKSGEDQVPQAAPSNAPSLFTQDYDQPRLSRRASDVVLDIIRTKPGIKGAEIVRASEEIGEPVLERTVRTALYRMKRGGQIRNLDGGWYASPTQTHQHEGSGDDD